MLLYEMRFLVPNYSCLQNHWLGDYCPQIPVLSALCPQLNLLNPPSLEQNSWVRHWEKILQKPQTSRVYFVIWTTAIIVPTAVAKVRRNISNTKSILWLALSVPKWTLTQSLSLNSSSCKCKWKSQVYIQNTNARTIARPHTQTHTYTHTIIC